MPIIQFQTLWKNHPTIAGGTPVLDKATYQNQCAINVAVALKKTGVSMADYRGAVSWQKEKPKYAIRAQELAHWLRIKPRLPGRFETLAPAKFADSIKGRAGIIFFKNYWGSGRQGDHIDLWNGSRLTAALSGFRIRFHLVYAGVWEDLEKAEEIWFWEVS